MTEPTQTPEPQQPNGEAEADEDETTTFDREYVQGLRAEAAEARTKANEATTRGDTLAELLLTRSIERAAGDVLQDVTDLPRTGDLFADDGAPDLDKIKIAAQSLIETKPHLARVGGQPVHQGAKESEQPTPGFGDLIRARMGA